MTSRVDSSEAAAPLPGLTVSKHSLRRAALSMLVPLAVYAVVRPMVSSDSLALGIAAGVPILYTIALAIVRRRIEIVALLAAVGYSVACVVSVLTGGSSLPLKLHEAFITFVIGLVLLCAVLLRCPIPVAHLLRVPSPDRRIDSTVGSMIGAFLVLHSLLHFMLAVSLSTGSYLGVSRVVNAGTLILGILALTTYVRRIRTTRQEGPAPIAPAQAASIEPSVTDSALSQ